MKEPTFLSLLNANAENEAEGQSLLNTWAGATPDAKLYEVLRFVAMRECEHAVAFTKCTCELGHAVDVTKAYQFFRNDTLSLTKSNASDAEKLACRRSDLFDDSNCPLTRTSFRADTTMEPQTGALMGRHVCEERDNNRRLKAEYERVCNARPRSTRIDGLWACMLGRQQEVEKSKGLRSVA